MSNKLFNPFLTSSAGMAQAALANHTVNFARAVTQTVTEKKAELQQIANAVKAAGGLAKFNAALEANATGAAEKFAAEFGAALADIQQFDGAFNLTLS